MALPSPAAGNVLEVDGLRTHFFTRAGVVKAVDDVSFTLARGEVMGLVGESGSGKSVTGYSLLGLVDEPGRIVGGRIVLDGTDLRSLPPAALRHMRRGASIIATSSAGEPRELSNAGTPPALIAAR